MWRDEAYLLDMLLACRKVSPEFQAAHGEVPWREISGLRNRIVHEYFQIIPERVWDAVTRSVPALIPTLEALVPPEA